MVKYVGYGWFDTPYLKPLAGCPQEYLGRPMRPETPSEIRLVPHSARYVGSDTSGGDASDNHDIPNAVSPEETSFLEAFNDQENSSTSLYFHFYSVSFEIWSQQILFF